MSTSQTNVPKQLKLPHEAGLLARRKQPPASATGSPTPPSPNSANWFATNSTATPPSQENSDFKCFIYFLDTRRAKKTRDRGCGGGAVHSERRKSMSVVPCAAKLRAGHAAGKARASVPCLGIGSRSAVAASTSGLTCRAGTPRKEAHSNAASKYETSRSPESWNTPGSKRRDNAASTEQTEARDTGEKRRTEEAWMSPPPSSVSRQARNLPPRDSVTFVRRRIAKRGP